MVERKTISLVCFKDNEPVPFEIDAYVCNGLAIHKAVSGKGYTLTHLKSSMSLTTGLNLSVAAQKQALTDIAQLLDWTRPFDAIASMWLHDEVSKGQYLEKIKRLRA